MIVVMVFGTHFSCGRKHVVLYPRFYVHQLDKTKNRCQDYEHGQIYWRPASANLGRLFQGVRKAISTT